MYKIKNKILFSIASTSIVVILIVIFFTMSMTSEITMREIKKTQQVIVDHKVWIFENTLEEINENIGFVNKLILNSYKAKNTLGLKENDEIKKEETILDSKQYIDPMEANYLLSFDKLDLIDELFRMKRKNTIDHIVFIEVKDNVIKKQFGLSTKNNNFKFKMISYSSAKKYLNRILYQQAEGNSEVLPPYKSFIEDKEVLGVIGRVDVSPDHTLYTIIESDFYKSLDTIEPYSTEEDSYFFLLDKQMNYILHPELSANNNMYTLQQGSYMSLAQKISRSKTGIETITYNNCEKLLFYKTLKNKWVFVEALPTEEIKMPIHILFGGVLLITLVGILIAIFISQYISERITSPILNVTRASKAILNKNYEYELTVETNDEIGIMAEAFNKAVKEIISLNKSHHTLAYHSSTTGLGNKNALMKYLKSLVDTEKEFSLFYLDIDNFSKVTDSLGEKYSDDFINQLGDQFNKFISDRIELFHIYSDEFVFVYKGKLSQKEIKQFIHEIQSVFNENLKYNKKQFILYLNIGVVMYPEHNDTVESIFRSAKLATHIAEQSGHNNYKIYTEKMREKLIQKNIFEKEFIKALKEDEFELYYQPKYSAKTEKIVSAEALIRWIHPEKGMISPGKFIPYAEAHGYILALGERVLKKACRYNKFLQAKYDQYMTIAVNLSADQLKQKNIVNKIAQILNDVRLEPKYLELEITESTLLDKNDRIITKLNQLKDLGISIALDDFGTGYSSLDNLKNLPIDNLKIDKGLLDRVIECKEDQIIFESTVMMARKLGLKVTIEGVETEEQVEYLRQLNCDVFQGYYYSKPVDEKKFATMGNLNEDTKLHAVSTVQ